MEGGHLRGLVLQWLSAIRGSGHPSYAFDVAISAAFLALSTFFFLHEVQF